MGYYMGKIVAITNQKGGVGKSTTTLNLGYALAEEGKRVLVVDLDPQSSLTISFGVDKPDELDSTIYNLMTCIIEEKDLSAKGLELLLHTIARVKKRINPHIIIDGILLTMFDDRTRLTKEIVNLMEEAYKGHLKIFDIRIPVSIKVGESNFRYKSVIEYEPKSKVAPAYKEFGRSTLAMENVIFSIELIRRTIQSIVFLYHVLFQMLSCLFVVHFHISS